MLLNAEVQNIYGYDPTVEYDYQVYALPFCAQLSWAGIGWVGVPGSFLSITGSSYDQAFAHEVGHNSKCAMERMRLCCFMAHHPL